jgi:hypothetical protein
MKSVIKKLDGKPDTFISLGEFRSTDLRGMTGQKSVLYSLHYKNLVSLESNEHAYRKTSFGDNDSVTYILKFLFAQPYYP